MIPVNVEVVELAFELVSLSVFQNFGIFELRKKAVTFVTRSEVTDCRAKLGLTCTNLFGKRTFDLLSRISGQMGNEECIELSSKTQFKIFLNTNNLSA